MQYLLFTSADLYPACPRWVLIRRGKGLLLKEASEGLACWLQVTVAKRLGLGKSRIGQLIDEGKLTTVTIHGRRYVTDKSVRQYEEDALGRRMKGGKRVKA